MAIPPDPLRIRVTDTDATRELCCGCEIDHETFVGLLAECEAALARVSVLEDAHERILCMYHNRDIPDAALAWKMKEVSLAAVSPDAATETCLTCGSEAGDRPHFKHGGMPCAAATDDTEQATREPA